jgi:hypothetical protein
MHDDIKYNIHILYIYVLNSYLCTEYQLYIYIEITITWTTLSLLHVSQYIM